MILYDNILLSDWFRGELLEPCECCAVMTDRLINGKCEFCKEETDDHDNKRD